MKPKNNINDSKKTESNSKRKEIIMSGVDPLPYGYLSSENDCFFCRKLVYNSSLICPI